MSWADLFILPTLADCWGMVVNESLYYGAPVIVTTAAGSAEIIVNDVNGKTVAPGDPQALAAVICALTKDKRSLDALKTGAAKTTSNITDSRVGAKPLIEAIIRAGAVS